MIKFSLKNKILLATSIIIMLFGTIIVVVSYNYTKDVLVLHKKYDFASTILEQSHETEQIFNNSLALVKTISEQQKIKDYLKQPVLDAQNPEILELANQYNINNNYASINILDKEGNFLVSTDNIYLGKNIGYRSYIKDAQKGNYSIDLFTGAISKKIGYFFTYPVMENGEVLGIISIKLNIGEVNKTIRMDALGPGKISIMLADGDGIVVYANNEDLIYKSLGTLSQEKIKEIVTDERLGGVVSGIRALNFDILQQKIKNIIGPEVFNYKDSAGNEERIAGMAKIGSYPFYIVADEDISSFTNSSFTVAMLLSAIIIGCMLLLIVVTYFIIDNFLKPIDELLYFSDVLKRGNFSEKLEISTGSELNALIIKFNEMAKGLDIYYKMMQSQIKIKSGEIERKSREIQLKDRELAETRSVLHTTLKKQSKKKVSPNKQN
jgi:methyl-accepting chemotaxis protein